MKPDTLLDISEELSAAKYGTSKFLVRMVDVLENPGRTDETMAPPGHSALYVLVPVSHQHPNIDWSKERDRYRQVALRQLVKLGLGDIERRIRFERSRQRAIVSIGAPNPQRGETQDEQEGQGGAGHRKAQDVDFGGQKIVGAPWLDGNALAEELNARRLGGVHGHTLKRRDRLADLRTGPGRRDPGPARVRDVRRHPPHRQCR